MKPVSRKKGEDLYEENNDYTHGNTDTSLWLSRQTKTPNASDYGDDISKAQEIAVVSPETAEVMDTITGAEDIKDFVLALEVDKWKLETLPEEATEIGSFGLAQRGNH